MRKWISSVGLPILLALVGTVALVYSWIYEKHELANASQEVARLERSQMVIDMDEIARDQWLIALDQEISRNPPNPEMLSVTAKGSIINLLRWESHMEMRVAGSRTQYEREIAARDALIDQAQRLAKVGNYPALLGMLQKFQALATSTQATSELDKQYFAQVDQAHARLAAVETKIRVWYIGGTAALLLSSIIASVLLEITLRRIERAAARPIVNARKK